MRVLVINYAMDEAALALAWQARVVRALAAYCERVTVLTAQMGAAAVPANVRVEALPGRTGLPWLGKRLAMLRLTAQVCDHLRPDAVFIHMAHRYAYQLYPVFAARRLPVLLWYAHGAVNWHLRLAHACVDRVISSTPEGFRLPSRKAYFIGQGVDTELFALQPRSDAQRDLITVSRISRRKRLELLLAALAHLRDLPVRLYVVGGPLTADDQAYARDLRAQAEREGAPVVWAGAVPLEALPQHYATAALHLNVSETNSMDKTVLEALAVGCPVLTSNPAFRTLLAAQPEFIVQDARPEALAAQIRQVLAHRAAYPPADLRAMIVGRHDLASYAGRVMEHLHALVAH